MAGSLVKHLTDDDSKATIGSKFHKWEKIGVPIRIELGLKEARQSCVSLVVHPAHSISVSKNIDLKGLISSSVTWKRGSLVIGNVPMSAVVVLCQAILEQCRSPSESCSKLHIRTSDDVPICETHLKHLVQRSKPCHCHQGHLSLSELQAHVEASLEGTISWVRLGERGEEVPCCSDEESREGPCTLLVNTFSGQSERQLSDSFAAFGPIDVSYHTGRPARVRFESAAAARRAIEALSGQGLEISFQLGRRDKLYPLLPYEMRAKMRVGPRAAYSTTDQLTADQMTAVLAFIASAVWCLDETKLLPLTLTDATACCGGNSMSFLSRFQHVNAVELDEDIFRDLEHNLQVLGFTSPDRLSLYCANYLDIRSSLEQHCVFIDPPWSEQAGPGYNKSSDVLTLKLGSIPVADLCIKLLQLPESSTRIVALKLPTRGTDPQAFFRKVFEGLKSDAVASGVSFRFGRSLFVVIVLGVSPEEMQSLMKQKSNQIKLHYQLLK